MKTSYAPNIARGIVSGEILHDIRDSCEADPQYMGSVIRSLREKFGLSAQTLTQKWQECGISPEILRRLESGEVVSESELLQAQLVVASIYADGLLMESAETASEAELAEAVAEAVPAEAAAGMTEAEDEAG